MKKHNERPLNMLPDDFPGREITDKLTGIAQLLANIQYVLYLTFIVFSLSLTLIMITVMKIAFTLK